MESRITSSYVHKLQAIYHKIDNRGICISLPRLEEAALFVEQEITKNCAIATQQWGCRVYLGAENKLDEDDPDSSGQVNINSTSGENTLLRKLQDLGYKVPKITKKNNEGEYEAKYSTAELALQKMLVENQFNYNGGDPAIRAILAIRELGKLRSSYIYCDLYKASSGNLLYLSNYNCGGTLTGRRSSRKHAFGFGNNAQNFPKHGRLAAIFRRCLVARPGNILFSVDQKSAEEWPVSALAKNYAAIQEMQNGINRHIKRASFIFGIAENTRTEKEWKDAIEYYLGKKTGHANNYGMQPNRMSDSLAQEGHSIAPAMCKNMLDKLNTMEPNIKSVFHEEIKNEVATTRMLRTPFGRERQFLGLRPNDNNYGIFNEAYAYIPQSTVGDNTGFAVCWLESESDISIADRFIVQEGHDSIIQDIKEDAEVIWRAYQEAEKAFDRKILFKKQGIEIQIPIEAELGFDLNSMVKIKDFSIESVRQALMECRMKREVELEVAAEQARERAISNIAVSV